MLQRNLTEQEIQTYRQDGATLVKNAVDPMWVDVLIRLALRQLENPSKWGNDQNPGALENRMFTDRYLWRENSDVYGFITQSGCARLAAQAMGSRTCRFYFDHLLIKQPKTASPTPWHQDAPYWPFEGKQICSIWVATTTS